jgi:microcystin-dependent protein
MIRKTSSALLAITGSAVLATAVTWSQPAQAFDPFIGTIRYFGFNFAPRGWAFCDGQLLAVNQNEALFALLGTTYGGDGRTTFGLPDMRGRLPVHQGQGPGLSSRSMGQKGGAEVVTLSANQIGHSHTLRGNSGVGNQSTPTGHALAEDTGDTTYRNEAPSVAMHADSIGTASGGGQSHENRPPFLGVTCNIALVGVFPSRN